MEGINYAQDYWNSIFVIAQFCRNSPCQFIYKQRQRDGDGITPPD